MKIVFMGTPDFAAASLRRLYEDGREIAAVFTQPDKPKYRGMKLTMSPVKELALERGTPVYQPQTVRDGEAESILRAIAPDVIVVVAYGRILPQPILDIPPMGCINIHGSILPRLRGSAPVQWAVLNGDREAGVTSMYMAAEMDAGDMIFIKKTPIGEDETAGELYARLAGLGAELLLETLDAIGQGVAPRIPQDHSQATYAPPLKKDMSPIDWTRSCREISCHVRGLNPWPVATAELFDTVLKVYAVKTEQSKTDAAPGTVLSAGEGGIQVACADGVVTILEVQAPGKRRMAAADYLRGRRLCL
jgi:methionyl-tRNA formyltransferase